MSIRTRVFATAVAASLLVGTASFALGGPRAARRVSIDETREPSAFGQLFEWAREIVRVRFEGKAPAAPQSSLQQKDGSGADPFGRH
jgi:hypothetical protein